jgi:hypothetical protein
MVSVKRSIAIDRSPFSEPLPLEWKAVCLSTHLSRAATIYKVSYQEAFCREAEILQHPAMTIRPAHQDGAAREADRLRRTRG